MALDFETTQKALETKKRPSSREMPWHEIKKASQNESGLIVDQNQIKSGSITADKVDQKWIKSRSNKINAFKESGLKVDSEVDHEVDQKRIKTGLNVDQKIAISEVVGLQKKLLIQLFENCLNKGSKVSDFFSLDSLANLHKSSRHSIKSGIRQLRLKGILEKNSFKDGRGGGTSFIISDIAYRDLLNESGLKQDQKWIKRGLKVDSEVDQQVGQNLSSSSSSYLNNTNSTTTGDLDPELIDSSPLKMFGFGINHIKQCFEKKWGFDRHPIELQQSIFHIRTAFDKGILAVPKGPGLIMEQLKRGKYHAPDSIKASDTEFSLEKAMPWWDNLLPEYKIELQKEYNFDRMKNNEEKRAKIAEIYQENIRDVGSGV